MIQLRNIIFLYIFLKDQKFCLIKKNVKYVWKNLLTLYNSTCGPTGYRTIRVKKETVYEGWGRIHESPLWSELEW